jgi:hypothetical protein
MANYNVKSLDKDGRQELIAKSERSTVLRDPELSNTIISSDEFQALSKTEKTKYKVVSDIGYVKNEVTHLNLPGRKGRKLYI